MAKPRIKANFAEKLDEDILEELGQQICEWYDTDLTARRDWESVRKEAMALWLAKPDPDRMPAWPGGSNVALPITASACSQFSARAYASVTEAPDIAKLFPTEPGDVGNARNVQNYMNWQIRNEMTEWEEEFDKVTVALPIEGTVFKKVFYCQDRKRVVTEFVSGIDVVLPYKTRSLESARRITHRYYRHWDELRVAEEKGFFYGVEDMLTPNDEELDENAPPPSPIKRDLDDVEELINDTQGLNEPERGEEEPRLILESYFNYDIDGKMEPVIAWVDYDTKAVLRLTKRSWRSEPITYWADYHFIKNPYGFYSFGFAHFISQLNRIGDAIFNLAIDSGRLSNQPFGFYGRRSGFKDRMIELYPGSMHEVDDASQVYFPNMQRMDQSMFQLLGMIDRYTEIFTSNSEVMAGRQQKGVREPTARGTMALIEQGMTNFGTLTKRMHQGLRKELKCILLMNEMYVSSEKVFRVLGTTKDSDNPFGKVTAEDFKKLYDILPTADPSYASNGQRRAEMSEVMSIAMQHPMIGLPNPQSGQVPNPKAMTLITREWLITYGRGEIARAAFPDPPEPPMSPWEENALFLQGDTREPQPDEDHNYHLETHAGFLVSEVGRSLPQMKRELIMKHMRATQAMMMKAEMASQMVQPPDQGSLGNIPPEPGSAPASPQPGGQPAPADGAGPQTPQEGAMPNGAPLGI